MSQSLRPYYTKFYTWLCRQEDKTKVLGKPLNTKECPVHTFICEQGLHTREQAESTTIYVTQGHLEYKDRQGKVRIKQWNKAFETAIKLIDNKELVSAEDILREIPVPYNCSVLHTRLPVEYYQINGVVFSSPVYGDTRFPSGVPINTSTIIQKWTNNYGHVFIRTRNTTYQLIH